MEKTKYLICYKGETVTITLDHHFQSRHETISLHISDIMPHFEDEDVVKFMASLQRDIPAGQNAIFRHFHEGMYRYEGYNPESGDLHCGPNKLAQRA